MSAGIDPAGGRVVVVGAGHAGIDVAAALRMNGHTGPLTVIGQEAHPPYARPPLSKAFLSGTAAPSDLTLRSNDFYDRERIELRSGDAVTELDRTGRRVHLASGEWLPYDALVLATGATARRLPQPELASASNVLSLRSKSDATGLRERLVPGSRAVVIGGGYIGLEFASAARRAGLEVTLLEASDRVLARVTSPPVSEFFQNLHAEEGVEIVRNARAAGFRTDPAGDVTAVELEGGRVIHADFVLVGIGVSPRTELAVAAGLEVDNGIITDEYLRTSDPSIFAIGDVARHPCAQHGGLRRLESAPNASEQARAVAKNLLGTDEPFEALPWFWSDQYDVKLQSVGLSATADSIVVRPTPPTARRLSVFYLKDGRLIAADIVGAPADFAVSKKLISERVPISAASLADADVPLRTLLAASRAS